MRYRIRYTPGTVLARRFPEGGTQRFAAREEAESVRRACPNAAHMEVVEVGDDDA